MDAGPTRQQVGTGSTGTTAANAEAAATPHGTPAPSPSSPEPAKTCSWSACGRELSADAAQNKRCGRCKSEFYCGRACQKKHWKEGGHKLACEEPPCCTICLEGGEEPLPIQRGCGCRGDMGLAHTACLAKMNAHKAKGHHVGWYKCPTCRQWYTGAMRLALARALMHRLRLRRRDDDDRLGAEDILGTALFGAGEFAEAEKVQTRLLAARKRVSGKEHPDTLDATTNLANTYNCQSKLAEAEELQVWVLAASKRVRGQEHPDTLNAAHSLANTHRGQGKLAEAEELQLWALAAMKRVRGKEHPNTLNAANNLAITYSHQGRLAEAEELLAWVLAVSVRVRGKQHPETIRAADNLDVVVNVTHAVQSRLLETAASMA